MWTRRRNPWMRRRNIVDALAFKLHIAYVLLNCTLREFRGLQIATSRHIALVALVGSVFGEICFRDVVYITDSCTSFV